MSQYWKDSSGVNQPILGVSATNISFMRPASSAAYAEVENYAGTAIFRATNDSTNPAYLFVNGALKNVTVGASNSGGTGYRQLIVPN
jgi:hypothetical protein